MRGSLSHALVSIGWERDTCTPGSTRGVLVPSPILELFLRTQFTPLASTARLASPRRDPQRGHNLSLATQVPSNELSAKAKQGSALSGRLYDMTAGRGPRLGLTCPHPPPYLPQRHAPPRQAPQHSEFVNASASPGAIYLYTPHFGSGCLLACRGVHFKQRSGAGPGVVPGVDPGLYPGLFPSYETESDA